MSQLPLELRLAAHARLDTFVARDNAAVVEHLRALDRGGVWLWGAAGVGKSHLLQAMCRARHARGQRSMYVPLGEAKAAAPGAELLTGLEALDFVALDDVQAVAGQPEWELALFRLFEALVSRDFALLLAARSAPLACGFNLPDLASRAAAAVVYRIAPLDDEGRLVALRSQAAHRGLELDEASARYLLSHQSRDMAALCSDLDRLDRESMAAQRRLTIPFIREALARGPR